MCLRRNCCFGNAGWKLGLGGGSSHRSKLRELRDVTPRLEAPSAPTVSTFRLLEQETAIDFGNFNDFGASLKIIVWSRRADPIDVVAIGSRA